MVAIGPVVSEEKSFEIVDGRRTTDGRRTDDGRRTTEPAYTISSPGAFGSGELKKVKVSHSLTAVGAVGVGVGLYLGHSKCKVKPIFSFRCLNYETNSIILCRYYVCSLKVFGTQPSGIEYAV